MSKLLVKWVNFGSQKREIRTSIVFGKNGENAIIVLENDEVLACGENQDGCLGTGVQGEVKELKRIKNLSGQRIERFECGVCCGVFEREKFRIFAISESGSVFSWGENNHGELGTGTIMTYAKVPAKISGSLKQERVVQVACGNFHTLALTSEGEVHVFGRNDCGQLGLGTSAGDQQSLPRKVGGLLDGKIVTSVACQNYASFALLQSGEICAWGFNSRGRLGITSNSLQECSPSMVVGLEGVVISQIVCGADFTLALSDDGKIYSWGENNNGQLGNGTTQFFKSPTIISTDMGKITNIAATRYWSHPCAAITENNLIYIWGHFNGQTVKKPMLTSFSSFDIIFAVASPPETYQRFQLKESKTTTKDEKNKKGPSIIERLRNEFDNPETADFAFIVEGKKIHVHKIILSIGSIVFKVLFLGDRMKDSCKKEHIVKDHSYESFYAFLKYFYTDEVDITPELALDVYALACFYQVTDLKEECEQIIKSNLTLQNFAAVYEKAISFGSKDLRAFCFKFCKENMLQVMNTLESDDRKTAELILEIFRWLANQKKN